jgi:CBS domain-containing protein
VARYVSSQIKSGNPDTVVRDAVMREAIAIMAENGKRRAENNIDAAVNALWIGILTLKGYKVDRNMRVDILDLEKGIKVNASFKASDLVRAIRDGTKMNVLGHELDPVKVIEGIAAGGLILDHGQFYRHDKFAYVVKRPVFGVFIKP